MLDAASQPCWFLSVTNRCRAEVSPRAERARRFFVHSCPSAGPRLTAFGGEHVHNRHSTISPGRLTWPLRSNRPCRAWQATLSKTNMPPDTRRSSKRKEAESAAPSSQPSKRAKVAGRSARSAQGKGKGKEASAPAEGGAPLASSLRQARAERRAKSVRFKEPSEAQEPPVQPPVPPPAAPAAQERAAAPAAAQQPQQGGQMDARRRGDASSGEDDRVRHAQSAAAQRRTDVRHTDRPDQPAPDLCTGPR